jgi:uncharacterized protein
MFVHIAPEETRTLRRVPHDLLFPAPGMPDGHVLMGYGDNGECPMLVNGQCSIYEDRPQTCRDYDCRVLATTGVAVDPDAQPDISRRVKEWAFQYETEESRQEQAMLRRAAVFLQNNRELFPPGSLPNHPNQLAALAIGTYRVIARLKDQSPQLVVDAIVDSLRSSLQS